MPSARLEINKLPRPAAHGIERRHNRSESTAEALELALTSAANRAQLDALLLVDDAGLVVSQNHSSIDLSMLAAVTPIIGRGKALPRIKRGGEKREMSVRPLDFEGEVLYVAAVGGDTSSRNREVGSTIAAAKRILAA